MGKGYSVVGDGYYNSRYLNGDMRWHGYFKGGNYDGYWEYFFSGQKLQGRGCYKDGVKVGYWEEYNNDGILFKASFYID